MRRVGLLSLAAAAAFACFLATGARPALAYRGGPSSPITDPANKAAVKALLQDVTSGSGESAATRTGLARMQMAAGRLASLKVLGNVSMITTGSITVWKIADSLGLGGYVYKKITGESYDHGGTGGTFAWRSICASGCGATGVSSGTLIITSGWILRSSAWGFPYDSSDSVYAAMHNAPGTERDGGTGVVDLKTRTDAEMAATLSVQPSTAAEFASPPSGATTATVGTDDTSALSDADYNAALAEVGATDSTNRSTSDAPAEAAIDYINHQLDPTYSADTFAMPNCVDLSVSACGALLDAHSHTGARTGTVLSMGGAVITKPAGAIITTSPGASTTITPTTPVTYTRNPDVMPVLLPQPLLNETADEFIARLHALGYTGTVSVVELTDATGDPTLGQSAPVRIRTTTQTTTGTATPVLSPLAWPSADPRIAPDVDVTIEKNPDTYPPATLEELPPPGTTGGTTPTCDCPPINFGPLTGLDLGSQFPFAIFGYVTSTLALFDVSPVPPGFDIDVSAHGTSAHAITNPGHYTGDLEAFSPYMEIVRTLMAFALWIGALWFVGARLLGFGAAGDLSEAADDGSVV